MRSDPQTERYRSRLSTPASRAGAIRCQRAGTISTRNDISRSFSARSLRRGEDRQVSAVPCEIICGDRAIADGGQFATQELNWRAMLRRWKLKVDNSDPGTPPQSGREIVEEGIWLGYLVIHVHKD